MNKDVSLSRAQTQFASISEFSTNPCSTADSRLMLGSKENIIILFAAIGLVALNDRNEGCGSSDSKNFEEAGDQVTFALSET